MVKESKHTKLKDVGAQTQWNCFIYIRKFIVADEVKYVKYIFYTGRRCSINWLILLLLIWFEESLDIFTSVKEIAF